MLEWWNLTCLMAERMMNTTVLVSSICKAGFSFFDLNIGFGDICIFEHMLTVRMESFSLGGVCPDHLAGGLKADNVFTVANLEAGI